MPACTRSDRWLELVLLDVAGKGLAAGTRALMLSGATSGLLGAVPVENMMSALNTYLWRQNWTDGFATAAYLAVELATGSYRLVTAGHPPVVHFHAGSGRWSQATERGPALGVLEQAVWPVEIGNLSERDAILLYTDGVVEESGQDLSTGIDRMLGQAERFVLGGFAGGAERLLAQSRGRDRDDCQAVLLWRDSGPAPRSTPTAGT
ncbi:MAG: serine/threonine-protein phosphatase [Actinomycetota bacterium]|nr:serine/threonine-protein phosphatase [Actinomycetota bacterium]